METKRRKRQMCAYNSSGFCINKYSGYLYCVRICKHFSIMIEEEKVWRKFHIN